MPPLPPVGYRLPHCDFHPLLRQLAVHVHVPILKPPLQALRNDTSPPGLSLHSLLPSSSPFLLYFITGRFYTPLPLYSSSIYYPCLPIQAQFVSISPSRVVHKRVCVSETREFASLRPGFQIRCLFCRKLRSPLRTHLPTGSGTHYACASPTLSREMPYPHNVYWPTPCARPTSLHP